MSKKYEKLNSRIKKLGRRIDNIWTHLNLTGTTRSCAGGCGRLARISSNFCQSCMDTAILDKVSKRLATARKRETATEAVMREDTDRRIKHFHDCRDLYNWINGKTDKKPAMADKVLGKLSETAGERICDECGGKFGHTCHHMGISKPTPDLPLNARVAKALGRKVIELEKYGWQMDDRQSSPTGYIPIPDYPNDLPAAWDAFDTYLKQNDLMWKIERTHTGQGYIGLREIHAGCDISEEGDKVVMYHLKGETLAENFCEIIVAHAEQQ